MINLQLLAKQKILLSTETKYSTKKGIQNIYQFIYACNIW